MDQLHKTDSPTERTCAQLGWRTEPITVNIGVEVEGPRLSEPLSEPEIMAIRELLATYRVLVFRKQMITPAQHVAFARRFGPLDIHPVYATHPEHPELILLGGDNKAKARENIYHSDVSFKREPSFGSILRCLECPPVGGDTIWVDMVSAYEALPGDIKDKISGLTASHDLLPSFDTYLTPEKRAELRAKFPPQDHPVVRTIPETGKKLLYVNESFTTHFTNFYSKSDVRFGNDFKIEGDLLLHYLFRQIMVPEFQMRLRWEPNTVVFWDNRTTQHYAVQDYYPAVRRMMRATIVGEVPA
jgi:taurine dioxygenase